jgi:hypothetical protein
MNGVAGGDLWAAVRASARTVLQQDASALEPSPLESSFSTIAVLRAAPPRTSHNVAVVRSSPMPSALRAIVEHAAFGRRYDAIEADLTSIRTRLPTLDCPEGPVTFLAGDGSFDDLTLAVDCLLQHRKALLAASIDPLAPRRNVLVLGAGPGGLMTSVQLALRGHRVIVCEQREEYTRNRFIGVYKEVAHLLASLGMPERMTYDFTHYRGKRGVMLADLQTFLHAIALKLGVILYTGAIVRDMTAEAVRSGRLELHRSTHGRDVAESAAAIGVTRWRQDAVTRVRSGVSIWFDTIVEATGGRSGLRELIVGRENVVSLRAIGRDAALRDPSLDSYFDDPRDHCAQFMETDYGCPPAMRRELSAVLRADDGASIPDELPSLVSNVDASIIARPIEATPRKPGIGARLGEIELNIPRDWVLVRCPLPDHTLMRYQIEGPLPQTFEFGGKRIPTRECLDAISPVNLLVRLLYAMGVPFDAVDRRRLVEFYATENSQGSANDVVATFVGTFRGLRIGGDRPIWCGSIPYSDVEYGIVGEALQNAWYRFGVGVDDTCAAAEQFARCLELPASSREAAARQFEGVMLGRSIHVLYHLYLVQQNAEQGVVGPVLTECYMDRQYATDLLEARLRTETRQLIEMAAALADLGTHRDVGLLEHAVAHRRTISSRRVFDLFRSSGYPPNLVQNAERALTMASGEERQRAFHALEAALSSSHRQTLALVQQQGADLSPTAPSRSRDERLIEVARGRYRWATAWVRVCALRELDSAAPDNRELFRRLSSDADRLVAETAAAMLEGAVSPIFERVVLLERVGLFTALAHEQLVPVASLLSDRRAAPGEAIVRKGDVGDCLYIVVSGTVRVHDGERTLAQLGRNAFFGELALLDAEPRSTDVTATEESRLLRLQQRDFYALLSEQPQIVHAINRRLCEMVRGTLNA